MIWTKEILEILASFQNKMLFSERKRQKRRQTICADLLRCATDSGCSQATLTLLEHSKDIPAFIIAGGRGGTPVSTQDLFYEVGISLFVTHYGQAKCKARHDEALVTEAYKVAVSYQLRSVRESARRSQLLESALASRPLFARVSTRGSFIKDYFQRFEVADGAHEVDVTIPLAQGAPWFQDRENSIRIRVNETVCGIGFFRPGFSYWNETLKKRIQSAHRDARSTMEAADWSGPMKLRGDLVWLA